MTDETTTRARSQLVRIEVLLRAASCLPEVLEVIGTSGEDELLERLGRLLATDDADLIQIVRDARLDTFRPRSLARLQAQAVELAAG